MTISDSMDFQNVPEAKAFGHGDQYSDEWFWRQLIHKPLEKDYKSVTNLSIDEKVRQWGGF